MYAQGAFVYRAVLLISNCILENMSMVLLSSSWQAVFSLVPRPTLAPSQNGLAYKVEFLGFIGGAMSFLIDYLRCELLYKGLLRSLH